MNNLKIGIDLGTTFSCCGVYKSEKVDLITFNDSNRTIPSYVFFNPKSNEKVVGSAAKNNPKAIGQSIFDSKRFIGRSFDDDNIQDDIKHWPFKVVKGDKNEPVVEMLHNNVIQKFTANQISTEILKSIKEVADDFLGQNKNNKTQAVITVPAYFNHQQRVETKKAAEAANLEVSQIINEPTAAAIAYAYQKIQSKTTSKNEETLLIYDFGGGTFDVSIMKINFEKQEVRVLATGGDSHLGGEDIDQILVDFFLKKYNKPVKEKQQAKLKKSCEKSKILLSAEGAMDASIDCEWLEDAGINTTMTKSEFENLLIDNKILARTMNIVQRVLNDTGLKESEIDDIVLVGGSSRIPLVSRELKSKFPKTTICKDTNPDEVVALGATVAANLSEFRFKVFDVVCHSLSTDINDNDLFLMIKRNTPTPCKYTQTFANGEDNQDYVDVTVFEGDSKNLDKDSKPTRKDVNILNYYKLEGLPLPNKAKEFRIAITYCVDENGILTVDGKAEKGSQSFSLTIPLK